MGRRGAGARLRCGVWTTSPHLHAAHGVSDGRGRVSTPPDPHPHPHLRPRSHPGLPSFLSLPITRAGTPVVSMSIVSVECPMDLIPPSLP